MASLEAAKTSAQQGTLHRRLAEELIGRIRLGEWPVGACLPSEMSLSKEAGVSRQTLRHALKTLQAQGFVELRQGTPSKVISCTPPRVYSQSFNTLRDVLRYPSSTYRENQIEQYVECTLALQSTLQSPVGTSWYHIGAVRRDEHSNMAVAWSDIYILGKFARVTKLKNHQREMVFEQIERHFGVGIDRAEIEVEASTFSREHAKQLGVSPGAPCLVVVRRYFDSSGNSFEVSVTRHIEKRFTLSMELRSLAGSSTSGSIA